MNDSANENPSPLRVLLAESSALVREGLRQLLDELDGASVVGEAATCAELHAILRTAPADLILLDLALPCPDLFASITSLKVLRPGVLVLALTQFVSPALERRCRDAGADYVVGKTAGLDQLIEVVRHFARRPSVQRESQQALTP